MSVKPQILQEYVLRLADNALILGQQVSAWCGHAPALEEDIAFANTALDLIGQATLWLTYASELDADGRSADDLAFLRGEREFTNALLVEQPNGDFGQSLMRQYIFDAYHYPFLHALTQSSDGRIAEIAQKSVKEVAYHLERSSDLIIRLGNGTDESRGYMNRALAKLWRYSGELCAVDDLDADMLAANIGPDLSGVKEGFETHTTQVFARANLDVPEAPDLGTRGRQGLHSEHMGRLLAEMQYLQRSFPNASW